jgi:hypothetical protein
MNKAVERSRSAGVQFIQTALFHEVFLRIPGLVQEVQTTQARRTSLNHVSGKHYSKIGQQSRRPFRVFFK